MKNLLFVSIAFPPKRDSECLQTAKYFYYLQLPKKLNIEVLTSASPTLFMPIDNALSHYDTGFSNKVEIKVPENKYLNFIKRKLFKNGIDWPDSKLGFHKQWKKALAKIQTVPDVIYSRSFPLSSTVMAMHLQQHYNVPWVLHLSDPWTESPVHKYNPAQYKYHKALEKTCFERATYICFTSKLTIELYKKCYPEYIPKYQYFPNVYDPQDIIDNKYEFKDKIKIVYTGGLVEGRNISYLLSGLQVLEKINPQILSLFDFVFAGEMDSQSRALFNQSGYENVRHLGALPYNEALDLQRSADMLLVIDNPIEDPKKAVYFPSKMLDYLIMKRKIFAITTLGGTTDNVLKSVDGIILGHKDADGIANALLSIAAAHQAKNADFFYCDKLPVEYASDYQANKLLDLITAI
jgi:glycosyltransferase involved in cell wall biosynthesis